MRVFKKVQSVEPMVTDLVNGWLKSYNLDYKLEQDKLNNEIDKTLNEYSSKNGGKGGNRPDSKFLLQDQRGNYYPILIEYKGYKDKLVKLNDNNQIDNRNSKNKLKYSNINSYALNGAFNYAKGVVDYADKKLENLKTVIN